MSKSPVIFHPSWLHVTLACHLNFFTFSLPQLVPTQVGLLSGTIPPPLPPFPSGRQIPSFTCHGYLVLTCNNMKCDYNTIGWYNLEYFVHLLFWYLLFLIDKFTINIFGGREVHRRLHFAPQQVLWPPLEIGLDLSKMVQSYLLTYYPPRGAPLYVTL